MQQAHLFVAVLGASSYPYAEATPDEQLASWIGAHVRAFEFYQGVPKLVVPDNTKTGVTKACRYDPDLNPTYQEMAMHYGVGVVPARPYKPRDKAKVESGVLLAERWIIAALRNRKFFSIEELNQALSRRLKNAKLRTANACVEEIDFRTARGLDKSVIRWLAQESAWVGTHENIFVLGPTGVARALWPAPWRRRHVAMGTPHSTLAPSRCFVISQWRGLMAVRGAFWRGSVGSMF